MALHIDGTMPDGTLDGSAKHGPWAVFDDEAQNWIVTGLRYRWQAAVFIRRNLWRSADRET